MTETLTVEELWQRAHELVRRGDFANAVRDLSLCYQMLQAQQDPRLYEVHKRWTEVHQLYLEDGARQSEPPAQNNPSVEAEAEAAANAGELDRAIELYESAAAQSPGNELVRERLGELRAAQRRAAELSSPPIASPSNPAPAAGSALAEDDWSDVAVASSPRPSEAPAAAAAAPAAAPAAASARAEDDWSDVAIESSPDSAAPSAPATSATAGSAAPATTAPAMAPDDAPVGMQSLDVAFSVGEVIESSLADELPVVGAPTGLPAPAATSGEGDVAFLQELLARVQANRRSVA